MGSMGAVIIKIRRAYSAQANPFLHIIYISVCMKQSGAAKN